MKTAEHSYIYNGKQQDEHINTYKENNRNTFT